MFKSDNIQTIEQARAYLKSRAADAVACYKELRYIREPFRNPIELARYLARYW